MTATESATFAGLVADAEVILCFGTGGVGKTTTSAATAIAAAHQGRRACVVTIDPARRLADALGIDTLSNQPTVIDGPWPGTVGALMLDTEATFDEVVQRHATSAEQADAILASDFYRNVSATMSGTEDYMAIEKLAELSGSDDWDVIIVDTAPTRNALSFLDAPRQLTRLLNNPIYRIVMSPDDGGFLGLANRAARAIVRQLSRVVGAEVVDDTVTFFQLFDGMEEGFTQRAKATDALLRDERTAFVLVASPRHDTLEEARHFLGEIGDEDLTVSAVVVNRVLPDLGLTDERASELRDALADTTAGSAAQALADLAAAAADEQQRIGELVGDANDALLVTVPLLHGDVHDVDGLSQIAGLLTQSPKS